MSTTPTIAEAVEAAYSGYRATARKSGRNPRLPYVPVLVLPSGGVAQTSQILARAYANRTKAVECAEDHLRHLRERLAVDLAKPNMRALREQHGLPRELVLS